MGLNIYPLGDPSSIGFILKLPKTKYWLRYSKQVSKFYFSKLTSSR